MTLAADRPPRSPARAPWRRWVPWAALVVVVAVALGIGAAGGRAPLTLPERVDALAAEVRCPTCRSESALDSDAATARAVRTEIARRLEAGESADDVRAYLVDRYGTEILLTPPATGFGALVWVLPVFGLIVAGAGLGVAFRRWRRHDELGVSDADRALVADARAARPGPGDPASNGAGSDPPDP